MLRYLDCAVDTNGKTKDELKDSLVELKRLELAFHMNRIALRVEQSFQQAYRSWGAQTRTGAPEQLQLLLRQLQALQITFLDLLPGLVRERVQCMSVENNLMNILEQSEDIATDLTEYVTDFPETLVRILFLPNSSSICLKIWLEFHIRSHVLLLILLFNPSGFYF